MTLHSPGAVSGEHVRFEPLDFIAHLAAITELAPIARPFDVTGEICGPAVRAFELPIGRFRYSTSKASMVTALGPRLPVPMARMRFSQA